MGTRVDISIIIVSYNCLASLKDCIDSINLQQGVSFETVVIDNASSDGTPEYLGSLNIKKALLQKNIGFGAAVNHGTSMAASEFLFILNPDTILPSGVLQKLHDFACGNNNAGLISPLIVWANGEVQRSARYLPARRDLLFGRGSPLFKLGITGEKKAGYIEIDNLEPMRVPAVSATAVMIKADLFRSIGGFDKRFFMYLEDIDLCKRIAEKGLEVWIVPEIKVIHGWRQSSGTRPYFTLYHHHLSVYKYFAKHYLGQLIQNFLLLLALVAGFIVSSVILTLGGSKRS